MIWILSNYTIVFDSKDHKAHSQISNSPNEIETLLEKSPAIAKINGNEILVGYLTHVSHRPNSSLYYEYIHIDDRYEQFYNSKIYKHDINYREPPFRNIYDAINIVTYVKEVD